MSILHLVSQAGQNYHTVMLAVKEKSGLVQMKEVEPYVHRKKDGSDFFYCYDIHQDSAQVLSLSSILSARETGKTFSPRYPVMFHGSFYC